MKLTENIIRLLSFEVEADIAGQGPTTVSFSGRAISFDCPSAGHAFALIARLAPEAVAAPGPSPAVDLSPLDKLGKTANNLRAVADALERGEVVVTNHTETVAAVESKEASVDILVPTNGAATRPAIDPAGDSPNLFTGKSPQVNAAPLSDEPATQVRKRKTTEKADKKTRNVVDDVAAQEQAAAEESPKEEPAAASKEPTSAASEEESTPSSATGLDESYISSASNFGGIVEHMFKNGVSSTEDIVSALNERKAQHPLLAKATITADRVERVLVRLGLVQLEEASA